MEIVQNIALIISPILTLFSLYVAYYFYIKTNIKTAIINGIAVAEGLDIANEDKFNSVVDEAMKLVPEVLKPIINRKTMEQLVQITFDGVKLYAIKRELNDK